MRSTSGYIQELLTGLFTRKNKFNKRYDERPLVDLCEELITEKGEISSLNLANIILSKYLECSDEQKLNFFHALSIDFDLNIEDLIVKSQTYLTDNSPNNLNYLRNASEPRRVELFTRLNKVPGATEQLVKMRADLLSFLKDNPEFSKCDNDLKRLFFSWFNRGFLVLRDIDWSTSADILEKIISYEAVHEISDWDDLRRRLQPSDRQCFAFFHPSMPTEPLIFVEVALSKGIAVSIQELLMEGREIIEENKANTAVFYSISNCQKGLKGVSFGNFLIKQVAKELSTSLPNIENFVTLSPLPTLSKWLAIEAKNNPDSELASFHEKVNTIDKEQMLTPEFKQTALSVAAHYLLKAKRYDGQPVDPVTRFHLGNGASVKQINWLGDVSEKGLKQSLGVMVNYRYDLTSVESFHESYAHDYKVTADKKVTSLLKKTM